MPELALLLWLLYGVGALGIRVAIHRRRTGSTGLVGIRSPAWSLPWLAEVMHTVAIAMGVAAPVLDVAGVIEPIGILDRAAVQVVGVALFGIGLSGVVVGQAQMGSSWRIGTDPDERTDLVTHGLFAYVRHPIYAALVMTLLGLALLVPSVVALASVALFFVSVEIESRVIEEPHLLKTHGEEYSRYAARVGRFFPEMGRMFDARRRVLHQVPEAQRRDIERLYSAFNRRDVEAVLRRLTPDVHWANGMEGGYVDGPDAVRDYWTRQFGTVQSQVDPEEMMCAEDGRVIVKVHQVVRSVDGKLLANQLVTHRFTFDSGRISRFDIVSA